MIPKLQTKVQHDCNGTKKDISESISFCGGAKDNREANDHKAIVDATIGKGENEGNDCEPEEKPKETCDKDYEKAVRVRV